MPLSDLQRMPPSDLHQHAQKGLTESMPPSDLQRMPPSDLHQHARKGLTESMPPPDLQQNATVAEADKRGIISQGHLDHQWQ